MKYSTKSNDIFTICFNLHIDADELPSKKSALIQELILLCKRTDRLDELVKECILAKSMGFESIIVDNGWQTLDGYRGCA